MQPPVPSEEDKLKRLKRLYVRQADVEAFGYTPGCPRCEHSLTYGPGRTQVAHNNTCRERIADCLKDTPEGKRRLEQHEVRTTQRIVEARSGETEGERLDAPVAQGENADVGHPEASSSFVPQAPPQFQPIAPRAAPATVTSAWGHLSSANAEAGSEQAQASTDERHGARENPDDDLDEERIAELYGDFSDAEDDQTRQREPCRIPGWTSMSS